MAECIVSPSSPDAYETVYRYDVKDLPTPSVTVYPDRAEVKRTVKIALDKSGPCEVVIYNLSTSCDLDSIRIEGQGKATITEVSSVEKLEEREKDESVINNLKDQMAQLEDEIKIVGSKKDRANNHRLILIGLGEQVKNAPTQKSTSSVNLLTSEGLDGVIKFLDLYDDQLRRCDDEIFQLDKDLKELADKSRLLSDKMNESSINTDSLEVIRQVSVLLDAKEAEEITLTVSYLVTGASWVPKYDIRAFTADVVVKITYFALITQKTGEDWIEAKLFLSTAQPSVGGDAPVLPSQTVDFKRYGSVALKSRFARSRKEKKDEFAWQRPSENDYDWEPQFVTAMPPMSLAEEVSPQMEIMTSEVQTGALSTSYEIARRSTIPSDNAEHKVTVAMLDFKPQFEHFTAPKMVPSSFLKAKVTNDSPYFMLAGLASTFVDNNFITKSSLPTVRPAEKFEISLGVDAPVRVTYNALQKITESSGLFNKATLTRYKKFIVIQNSHPHDITIQVEEQLPRSESDKIKVNLIAPAIPKQKGVVTAEAPLSMNPKGNIVWRSVIKAGVTETFPLHYTIEKAAGQTKDLEFQDV